MELLYLWIERYNNINDQEFLFSNEFNIKLNRTSKKLDITKSNSIQLNLFNNAFLNVSAIVGKNGSGKSSLVAFLKTVFSEDVYFYSHYIVVLKSPDYKLIVIDKISAEGNKVFEKESLEDGIPVNVERNNATVLDLVDLITHSNSFSIYETGTLRERFYDVSFNKSLDECSIDSNNLLINRYDLP